MTATDTQVDGRPSNPTLRRLAIKIAICHNVLPTSFLILGVKRENAVHRWSGGFADIFCGKLGDTDVAIKRVRVFFTIPEREKGTKLNW